MAFKVELCKHYTTTGYPKFRPVCKLGWLKAGLKCHRERKDCDDYKPSV